MASATPRKRLLRRLIVYIMLWIVHWQRPSATLKKTIRPRLHEVELSPYLVSGKNRKWLSHMLVMWRARCEMVSAWHIHVAKLNMITCTCISCKYINHWCKNKSLTSCNFCMCSFLRCLHLKAATLFRSLRTLLFSSSSKESWRQKIQTSHYKCATLKDM